MTIVSKATQHPLYFNVLVMQTNSDTVWEGIALRFTPGGGIFGTILEAGCLESHGYQPYVGLNFSLASNQLYDPGKNPFISLTLNFFTSDMEINESA